MSFFRLSESSGPVARNRPAAKPAAAKRAHSRRGESANPIVGRAAANAAVPALDEASFARF